MQHFRTYLYVLYIRKIAYILKFKLYRTWNITYVTYDIIIIKSRDCSNLKRTLPFVSFRLILSMSDSLNSSAGRTYLVLGSRFINIPSQMCPICHQLWSHMTVCNKNILFSLDYNFICRISYAACNMLNHILELNLTIGPTEFIFAVFKLVWSSTKVHKV